MIITRDEASKLMSQKMNALLRFTKRAPEAATNIELVAHRDGKTELVARALVKSTRDVKVDFFKNEANLTDHGVFSLNGLKRHITDLYSAEVWDNFVQGKIKLTRIKIDYALVEPETLKSKGDRG